MPLQNYVSNLLVIVGAGNARRRSCHATSSAIQHAQDKATTNIQQTTTHPRSTHYNYWPISTGQQQNNNKKALNKNNTKTDISLLDLNSIKISESSMDAGLQVEMGKKVKSWNHCCRKYKTAARKQKLSLQLFNLNNIILSHHQHYQ